MGLNTMSESRVTLITMFDMKTGDTPEEKQNL